MSQDTLVCVDCKKVFVRRSYLGPVPKRCVSCAELRVKHQISVWGKAKADQYEAEVRLCMDCDSPIKRNVRNGPFPLRCSPCRARARKLNNARLYANRAAEYAAKPHLCVDCGTSTMRLTGIGPFPKRCASCAPARREQVKVAGQLAAIARRSAASPCRACGGNRDIKNHSYCSACRSVHQLNMMHAKNGRRRTRLYTAPYEDIDVLMVFNAADWICALCVGPVDPDCRWPDPKSATLDHIIPIAQGGRHTSDNVQLAHFGCNSRKGARQGSTL